MNLYFCSDTPVAIKTNGIYFSSVDKEIKPLNINGEPPFIEICPLLGDCSPLNFFPTPEFFNNPPSGIIITDLGKGYLIKIKKSYKNNQFCVIGQQKFNDVVATVFCENGIKLSLETPMDFYAEELEFLVTGVKAEKLNGYSAPLLLLELIGDKKVVMIYRLSNPIIKVFEKEIDSYSYDNGFCTVEQLKDFAKHKVTVYWELKDNQFVEKNRSVESQKKLVPSNLPDQLIPYAFLEEFMVSGNYAQYLSENIKENAHKLDSYLGAFIGICPPPLFRNQTEIGLIYLIENNKYKVKYLTVSIENKTITNLTFVE